MIPERLLAHRLIRDDGCWEWTGARNPSGYGRIWWDGRRCLVHRIVAHAVHGSDLYDPAQVVRHTCDFRACFNPDHLLVGTQQENVQDMVDRGRTHKRAVVQRTHSPRLDAVCKQGHPLVGENVQYTRPRGWRCRKCSYAYTAEWARNRRAARRVRAAGTPT